MEDFRGKKKGIKKNEGKDLKKETQTPMEPATDQVGPNKKVNKDKTG